MGARRFQRYLDTLEACRAGETSMNSVYSLIASAEEANLVMSHQTHLLLANALWIEKQIRALAKPGVTIVDLGCWTGALTHWLAELLPKCNVVGIDAVPALVDFAKSKTPPKPNLDFVCWDYSKLDGKPAISADVLVSSVGIDFGHLEGHWSLDAKGLRACDGYGPAFSEAQSYLAAWRSIASVGAGLFAVLRIPSADNLLAFADAAQTTGWTLNLGESSKIDAGDDGKLPALSLSAIASSDRLAEDEVVSWYAFTDEGSRGVEAAGGKLTFVGARAIAFYRSLAPRQILAMGSHQYGDGHVAEVELGRVGSLAYLFVRATNGGSELQLAGTTQARQLRPGGAWGLEVSMLSVSGDEGT